VTPRRVAFVGAEPVFGPAVPAGLLVDVREPPRVDEMRAALARARPHATVVLGPPFPPPETLAGLGGLVLGVTTEPEQTDLPWAHRVVATQPAPGVWRRMPLPVADDLFAPVTRAATPPRALFLGRSTAHRERVLSDVKHHFDVLHVVDGVRGAELRALLRRTDVGLNAHREPGRGFEHRVAIHLACGHLVVSEPLDPSEGLEPDIDYVQVADGRAMLAVVRALHRHPQLHERVRIRGRRKAEQFRASRVWPRLVADAERDVAAFS
jgi:hypothetical protein